MIGPWLARGQEAKRETEWVVNSNWGPWSPVGVPHLVHLGCFRQILGWCICRCDEEIGIEPSTATCRGTWLCSETFRRGGAIDSKLVQFVWLLLMLLVGTGFSPGLPLAMSLQVAYRCHGWLDSNDAKPLPEVLALLEGNNAWPLQKVVPRRRLETSIKA